METIIFDMDGVIIDSEPLLCKLEMGLLEELGGKITAEEHDAFVGVTDCQMWTTLKKRFNIQLPLEEIIEISKKRVAENIHQFNLVDNFEQFMIALYNEGYIMGLASSNNRKIVDLIVDRFQLDKYLKVFITGEDVTHGKPNPEIFLKAAQQMNAEPSNCLVIEDAANGVAAAKAAGMKCIGLKNPGSGEQNLSQADLIITGYDELDVNIIKKLLES